MKRITSIEFTNYKAFFSSGPENIITIPEGKCVLLYGENGSGKSSIYEGIKQFLNSSYYTYSASPFRHIGVAQTRTENLGEESEKEVLNNVEVKVTFTDSVGNEQKIFSNTVNETRGTNYISQANLLNGFLSYKELLRTYLMENPKDKQEFRIKFAHLLIEVILAKQKNSVTGVSFNASWNSLHTPRAWYKEESLKSFNKGLKVEIGRINLFLPYILEYFEDNFSVQLELTRSEIVKHHSSKKDRFGKYPICEVDLRVGLFGEEIESEEENHLTVLNEARLSALAISIYLASLINTPQDNFEFKLLFLDDVFIGLDMNNRLPLLEILRKFKKPKIEQYIEDGKPILERIEIIDGIVQREDHPFFNTYQVFISTYDRFWFEVAKKELETKANGKWHYLELFANKKDENDFNTPLILNSMSFIQRADYYYKKKEYPECVNNLRKALEARIKVLLPPNKHQKEYQDIETGEKAFKPLKTLNQYLTAFIKYCSENGIDATELIDLKNLKDWYFNPFSHDNIGTPIFTRELDKAKLLVERLGNFEFQVLLPAATKLFFRFDNGTGQTREYKIELQENLRWIKSEEGDKLTNPLIHCYEWTKNGVVEVPAWGDTSLFHFYNNKWKALIKQAGIADFPMKTFWDEVFQEANNQPLNTLV